MISAESELNSLTACFHSVVHDLKTSNSSIDLVCSRAVKLANQLNATMTCLMSFADAIQVISDAAKWSSRDIGTTLTRFCLRQRAIENEIKVLASTLTDGFAGPLSKKTLEWKQSLSEIERRHQKNLKKNRSKKHMVSRELIAENRSGCSELLLEQRNQFGAFAGLLLPVINAQVQLAEEGLHIKAIKESIEQAITVDDPQAMINTVIEDVCHNDNSSWRKRLASPTRSMNTRNSCNDSSSSPSTSSMALSWNQNDNNSVYYGTLSSVSSSRPQTLSSSVDFGKRAALSAQTFVPPLGTPFVQNSLSDFAKPPLPRRFNDAYGNGNQTSSTQQNYLSGSVLSIASSDVSNADAHRPRPLSFNADDTAIGENKEGETGLLSEQISHLVDKFNDEIHSMCDQSRPQIDGDSNVSTVRQVGAESKSLPAPAALAQRLSVDSIRRPESIRPPPPMPPERRNSAISTATPTAPSIFDLRNAGVFNRSGSLNGRVRSIQDLNRQAANQFDQPEPYKTVVYRAPMFNAPSTSNYVNQHYNSSDSLPEPPASVVRPAMSYRPPPSTYNYDS